MMKGLLARAAPPVAFVILVAACGGGSSKVAVGPSSGETTTSAVAPDPSSTSATPAPPTTATPPGPPRPPVTGSLTTPPTARRLDAYLPTGVPDQVNPPGTEAYKLLSSGHCEELVGQVQGDGNGNGGWDPTLQPDLQNLYLAGGQACLSHWVEAEAAFRQVSTSKLCGVNADLGTETSFHGDQGACEATRLRVYRWTEKLLKAHRANPTFVPNFPPPG